MTDDITTALETIREAIDAGRDFYQPDQPGEPVYIFTNAEAALATIEAEVDNATLRGKRWKDTAEDRDVRVHDLEAERDDLAATLRFYADEETYEVPSGYTLTTAEADAGDRARAALARISWKEPTDD